MAFKLDDELLEELGLAALPPQEKQTMLRQILETLEMRVGTTLASRMSDAQLDEFERLMPAEGDDQTIVQQKEQQALKWLETNFPNYKQVVNDELEKLKVEIKQSAPQIISASQQNNSPVSNPSAQFQPQPMATQQPSQMPLQPQTYSQPPAPAPYTPPAPAQPTMPTPPSPTMQPQPGFSAPSYQYPPQPSANPTLQPLQPSFNPPTQPPQTFTPPPSPFQPPADNSNGYSQPPYPPQQPYQQV